MRENRLQDTILDWMGIGMKVRYFLFLSLGVKRTYFPADRPYVQDDQTAKISEPSGSRICRRNILALASILVLAGFAGVEPHNLVLFGVKLSVGNGDYVLCVAAILAQLYWYVMRYHHLTEDGTVPGTATEASMGRPTHSLSYQYCLETKSADLWANRVAAFMTLLSLIFIGRWMFDLDACLSQVGGRI